MIYTIVLHDVPLKMCNQNTPPDFMRCQKMRYSHPRYKYDHNQKIQHISWGHIAGFLFFSLFILSLLSVIHFLTLPEHVSILWTKS